MKRRLRFSLLTLLLVTTMVAMALAVILTRSQLRETQAESDRLKSLVGELSITDTSQVHVIAVPGAEGWKWRWRVYLPGGHDFGIFAYRGQLSQAGLPLTDSLAERSRIGGQTNPREPREIVLDLALGKTAEGDPCLWISENGSELTPITFDSGMPTWTGASKSFSKRLAGERQTASVAAAVPLGLIALDGVDAAGATSEDAVLVWIGPYEKTPPTQSLRDRGILP